MADTMPLLLHRDRALHLQISDYTTETQGLNPTSYSRQTNESNADSNGFGSYFLAIVYYLRPYPVIILGLLAIIESLIVASVGKVAGSFYKIVVDGHSGQLTAMLIHAAALYAAFIAISTAGTWLSGTFAVYWRQKLTSALHTQYCLQLNTTKSLDNPDQRITADTAALCEGLSQVARLAAAAPFKAVYYSWLAWTYVGWKGVIAAYTFFIAAAIMQKLVGLPLARTIFVQEKREGDFRFAHLRCREYSQEIAAYKASFAEQRALETSLNAVISNQQRIVAGKTALSASTKAADYTGALINYIIVAAAVFAFNPSGGSSPGKDPGSIAQFASNASFATLSLIYSFTELLDLADQVAMVAALARRVGQLMECLGIFHDISAAGLHENDRESQQYVSSRIGVRAYNFRTSTEEQRQSLELGGDGGNRERELQPSSFATTLQPPILASLIDGNSFEISVFSLKSDLLAEVSSIFPDAPKPVHNILACITFQFAANGLSLAPDRSSATLQKAAAEMDRMLDLFLKLEHRLKQKIAAHPPGGQYWLDAVDPRTGLSLGSTTKGTRWSEVAAAHALLGYERKDAGVCPIIVHPVHGTSAYPATIFTNAPFNVLQQALNELAADGHTIPWNSARPSSLLASTEPGGSLETGPSGPLLLSLNDITIHSPSASQPANRLPLIDSLSLTVHPGRHVLITGPNGAGKTTLLKAIWGLVPVTRGSISVLGFDKTVHTSNNNDSQNSVFYVPQRPLSAPGRTLWQQLVYPDTTRPSDNVLISLLSAVGLLPLLEQRSQGSFDDESDWTTLSPGEMQRLAFARVLHHKPVLALLDEATSGVSRTAARELYHAVHAAGITCVSVGQDTEELREVHVTALTLEGHAGRWTASDLS